MTIRRRSCGEIALEEACPVEDAAELHGYLASAPDSIVDWAKCDAAHTAVIQILLALRPTMRGTPRSPFLRTFIAPLLQSPELKAEGHPPAGVN